MENKNRIQEKVNELVQQRADLHQRRQALSAEYDRCTQQINEINGSIKVLVELFGQPKEAEASDSESEANSKPDSNEG